MLESTQPEAENLGGCCRILPTAVVIIRENKGPLCRLYIARGQGQGGRVDGCFEMIIILVVTTDVCRRWPLIGPTGESRLTFAPGLIVHSQRPS